MLLSFFYINNIKSINKMKKKKFRPCFSGKNAYLISNWSDMFRANKGAKGRRKDEGEWKPKMKQVTRNYTYMQAHMSRDHVIDCDT